MRTLITAIALAILLAAPAFTQSALVSVPDIIAIFILSAFFVPLALLFADRLVRSRTVATASEAKAQGQHHEAVREVSDRYRQAVSDLKRRALQLTESRPAAQGGSSTARKTPSHGDGARSEASIPSSIGN